MLHDQQDHQASEHNLSLIQERLSYSTLHKYITNWLMNCSRCQVDTCPYVGSNPRQDAIVIDIPMELLCVSFKKMVPSKDGKEKVIIMMDTFSKFSAAVVMPNNRPKQLPRWMGGLILMEYY